MTDNNTCYRFKPGDLVKVSKTGFDNTTNDKKYSLLRSSNLDGDENRVTTTVRVPRGEPVFIVDYFNKENPGLYVKWYVMYQEEIWWVYDDELEPTV